VCTTVNLKKVFFNLRKAKSNILPRGKKGDLPPRPCKLIAKRLGVTGQEWSTMNRRLGGDAAQRRRSATNGDSGDWQEQLVDESADSGDDARRERGVRYRRQNAVSDVASPCHNR